MPPQALSHTFRRNGLYYLRIVVPAALHALVGKTEFRYSLATGLRSEASLRANFLSSRLKFLFQTMRSKITAMQDLTQTNLAEALAAYIRTCIADFHVLHAKYKQRIAMLENPEKSEKEEFDKLFDEVRATYVTMNENETVNVLSKIGYNADESSLEKHMFLNASEPIDKELSNLYKFIFSGDAYNSSLMLERLNNYCNSSLFSRASGNTIDITAPQSPNAQTVKHTVKYVVDKYVEENKANWTVRTKDEFSSIFDTFVEICGNIDARNVTKDVIRDYKNTLSKLPQGWKRVNIYRDKQISQILEMKYETKVTSKTVNKHLSLVSSLLNWATNNGFCDKNTSTGMKIKLKTLDPKDTRSPWSTEELAILFSPKNYPMNGPAHMFWLPVLGLLTGARIDELCQLRCCDILQVEGLWCLNINDDDGKRIKTVFSRRIIPLHPYIVDDLKFIQFAEYCRSNPKAPLFPELCGAKAHAGKLASSHFSHFKTRVLQIDNDKISFHSLRHTVKKWTDSLKTDKRWVNDMFGWQNQGTGDANYGEKTPPSIMYENIIAQLPITTDLSFLKDSPYAKGQYSKISSPKKRMKWK